ncbi:MAG: stage II sporulation protein P [Bacillota bacterium]
MKDAQKLFAIILLFCSIIIMNLIIQESFINNKIQPTISIGSIFNANSKSKLKKYWIDLLYLDEFHAQLLLRKGLPVVRVDDGDLLKKSQDANKVVNLSSKILFDLPPSFFKVTSEARSVVKPKQDEIADDSNREKMRAEGDHQGEKVELDFWQTEPASNEQLPQVREDNDEQQDESINDQRDQERSTNREENRIVGIYHTHTAENYENNGYDSRAKIGNKGDIVKVGNWIKERLSTEYNIDVAHSATVHDKTYDKSYIRSLQTAKNIVNNNPELDMIFDIHRDAIGTANKDVITTEINGQQVAKIMIVVTNNNYGLPHPNWRKNVSFAKKIATKMNAMYPGLLRKVKFISNRRYNQHVHPQSLLLEIGGASSTLEEAKRSSYLFADVLAELMEEEL